MSVVASLKLSKYSTVMQRKRTDGPQTKPFKRMHTSGARGGAVDIGQVLLQKYSSSSPGTLPLTPGAVAPFSAVF